MVVTARRRQVTQHRLRALVDGDDPEGFTRRGSKHVAIDAQQVERRDGVCVEG
jgi:hypothetical protein